MTDKPPPQSQPFSTPSPFPPGSLQPQKRPSVAQRAKTPTLLVVIGTILGAAVQYLLTSHGVPPAVVDAAGRAVQQAVSPQNP